MTYTESPSDLVDDFWSGSTRAFADPEIALGPVARSSTRTSRYVYGDLIDDQFIAGPEAGIKIYVGNDGATRSSSSASSTSSFSRTATRRRMRSKTASGCTRWASGSGSEVRLLGAGARAAYSRTRAGSIGTIEPADVEAGDGQVIDRLSERMAS